MQYLFIGICCLLLSWSFIKVERLYTFPGITTIAFSIFLIPQFVGLYTNRDPVSLWAIDVAALLASSCLIICHLSYREFNPKSNSFLGKFNFGISNERIFYFGLLYCSLGTAFMIALGGLPTDELDNSQWSGTPVLYLFFARLIYPGFALVFFPTLKNPSYRKWICCLIFSFWPLIRLILFGRRTETATLAAIIILGLFFVRKIVPSRALIIALATIGIFFMFAVGSYRNAILSTGFNIYDANAILRFEWFDEFLNAINSVNWLDSIRAATDIGKTGELRYATAVIEASQGTGEFGLGTHYWNKFIFAYVPSQLVGSGVKSSLYLPAPNFQSLTEQYFSVRVHRTGLTTPVVAEIFSQFWFLGPLLYIPVARFFKRIWVLATEQGNLVFQILYALIFPTAVIAVVGGFANMINQIFYYSAFLLPVLLFSKRKI